MKIKLVILLIIAFQLSCKKGNSDLNRSWILVEQVAKSNSKGMYVLRGLLVDFEDDQMTYSYITSKDETKAKFWIEDQIIKYDTTTFGKIIHLSKDSLIIEADTNSFDMHFRPLEESHFSISEKQDIFQGLIENSWSIETLEFNQFFYCDTMIYYGMPEGKNDVRCIVYETRNKDWKGISDYEWWTLKHFDNKLILGFSQYQTENAFFQLSKNQSQKIKGQYMKTLDEDWMNAELKKEHTLSSEKLNNTKETIIGEWKIESIIEPNVNMKSLFEIHSELIIEKNKITNNKIGITETNLREGTINFLFKRNGIFQIMANGKEIRRGDSWELTNDGRYIKLEHGITGYDFIKIIDLSDNNLQILKKEMVDVEANNVIKSFQTYLNLKMVKKEN